MKLSLKNKSLWIAVFYIMSPYFPGNNFLELALIGSMIGAIAPFLPLHWDLGVVRAGIYIFYNAIAMLGLYLLQKNEKSMTMKDYLAIILMIIVLILSGQIPEPWGSIILFTIGLYFLPLRKIINYIKKRAINNNFSFSF